jgi:hypothetical protein
VCHTHGSPQGFGFRTPAHTKTKIHQAHAPSPGSLLLPDLNTSYIVNGDRCDTLLFGKRCQGMMSELVTYRCSLFRNIICLWVGWICRRGTFGYDWACTLEALYGLICIWVSHFHSCCEVKNGFNNIRVIFTTQFTPCQSLRMSPETSMWWHLM